MDGTILDEVEIRLYRRVRFEGDKEPPFWQVDVFHEYKDYHAVGATPAEALGRLAVFWESRDRKIDAPSP